MKAIRERMKKGLTISTKEGAKGALNGGVRRTIRAMSLEDFQKLYSIGKMVMESTNAGMEVRYATRRPDGKEVVIKIREKVASFKRSVREEREWRATTEIQLNMPKVETICQLLDCIDTPTHYYIVMEKVEGMDLFEQSAREKLKPVDAREVVRQILFALDAMHQSGRIHKDIKLENVMVDMSPKTARSARSLGGSESPATAKIIDFDTVQDWEPSSPKCKDVLGTDGYIAPEAYDGDYSPASDVFCVGVIMYKLLTHKFPYRPDIFDDLPGENWVGSPAMKRIKNRLEEEKIDFARAPLNNMPLAADLVIRMLAVDPNDRPTADQALNHQWFKLTDAEVQSGAMRTGGLKPAMHTPGTAKATLV
mmetsp:Transcript_75534/g.179445  ORF Transcript_75534/g.179445 Transcript_75534/m.179445 type:complete len:365 (+) Transcript_75534:117-1211(+)|eukprot:CAMPEP_0178422104 /NCGR_PEP_ID=MMETSP0689_2-20121128/26999_1 /TAXON_ID=160604 /ORGANISM="Amphidinium massartii, Strain CS-259" /LENGTH=364 /DNA_ID=CAMNT_0020043653 /DNA_START=27 /DNA_END=1121 /DNA_ORIENTATION=+